MQKILSLCGGGSSGYMTASFIQKIEEETGKSILDIVDMIAGVSTGSIIGGLLLTGHSGKEIKEIYQKIFIELDAKRNPKWYALFTSVYDNKMLNSELRKYIGSVSLGQLDKWFMCHSLCLNKPRLGPKYWKSWEDTEMDLVDIITTSCCAPIVFKPFELNGKYYIDGGLVLNDPSISVIAELHKNDIKEFDILCMQTDYHEGFDKPKSLKGIIGIMPNIISLAVDGSERATEYIARNILGDSYLNINPNIYLELDSNDWKRMDRAVEKIWCLRSEEILKFLLK